MVAPVGGVLGTQVKDVRLYLLELHIVCDNSQFRCAVIRCEGERGHRKESTAQVESPTPSQ